MRGQFLIALCLSVLALAPVVAEPLPIDQQPMYGGVERADALKQREAVDFVAQIDRTGEPHAQAARRIANNAWADFLSGDVAFAMTRFNQAWLLDPENGDVYHGFAVMTAQRGGAPAEAERFFKLAISKPKVSPTTYVDYAHLLTLQGRFDESLAQAQKALALSPTARNARSQISYAYMSKHDQAKACEWARKAHENGDALQKGYLEGVCGN
jgi:tetratricopeptide (TPR) repeat protein